MDILRKIWYEVRVIADKARGLDFAATEQCEIMGGCTYNETTIRVHRKLKKYIMEQKKCGMKVRLLDVGCGKGKMLKVFANCGCERIDGLEYSEKLCNIARRNVEKLGLKSNVFQGDASTWDGYDEYNYFYLFNPFEEELMRGFLNRIMESYNKNERLITIIYFNPKQSHLFKNDDWEKETIGNDRNMLVLRYKHRK